MFEAVPGQPRTWSAGSVPASAGEAAEGDEPDERDDQPEPEAPDDHHHDSNDDEDAADADPTHCELLDPTLIADIATFSQATAGAGEFVSRLRPRPPASRGLVARQSPLRFEHVDQQRNQLHRNPATRGVFSFSRVDVRGPISA